MNKVAGIPLILYAKILLGSSSHAFLNSQNNPGCHWGWCLPLELSWAISQALTLSKALCLCQQVWVWMEAAPTIPHQCHIKVQWMAKLCINSTENSKQNILKDGQYHLVLEREFLNQHQCCLSGVKKEQVNYSLLDTELVLRDLQILILVSLISLFSLSPPTQSFSFYLLLVPAWLHSLLPPFMVPGSQPWGEHPKIQGLSWPAARPQALTGSRTCPSISTAMLGALQAAQLYGHPQAKKKGDWLAVQKVLFKPNPGKPVWLQWRLLWKFFTPPQLLLCVFIPGRMWWFLHKYAKVQQQANFNMSKNKIILYMWIFADVFLQPGIILLAMAWVTQKKALAVNCKNSFFNEKAISEISKR